MSFETSSIIKKSDTDLQSVDSNINNGKNKKEVLSDTIKTCELSGKGKKLLRALSSFKPVPETKIIDETSTKNIKSLIFDVREKLEKSDLDIETIRAKNWGGETFYKIKFRLQ